MFCIHHINRMNSRNEFDSTITIVPSINSIRIMMSVTGEICNYFIDKNCSIFQEVAAATCAVCKLER